MSSRHELQKHASEALIPRGHTLGMRCADVNETLSFFSIKNLYGFINKLLNKLYNKLINYSINQ